MNNNLKKKNKDLWDGNFLKMYQSNLSISYEASLSSSCMHTKKKIKNYVHSNIFEFLKTKMLHLQHEKEQYHGRKSKTQKSSQIPRVLK